MIKASSITNITHTVGVGEMKLLDWELKVKKINESYEIVKAHMEGTFEATHKLRNNLMVDSEGKFDSLSKKLYLFYSI